MHTASWGEGRDLAGKRVAVVGTGATAVQLVPHLQPEVERLYVLQRTPPWILPLLDRPVGERLKRLYRSLPLIQKAARGAVYALREPFAIGMAIEPRLMKLAEAVSRLHLRRQVGDPQLRRRLTPD